MTRICHTQFCPSSQNYFRLPTRQTFKTANQPEWSSLPTISHGYFAQKTAAKTWQPTYPQVVELTFAWSGKHKHGRNVWTPTQLSLSHWLRKECFILIKEWRLNTTPACQNFLKSPEVGCLAFDSRVFYHSRFLTTANHLYQHESLFHSRMGTKKFRPHVFINTSLFFLLLFPLSLKTSTRLFFWIQFPHWTYSSVHSPNSPLLSWPFSKLSLKQTLQRWLQSYEVVVSLFSNWGLDWEDGSVVRSTYRWAELVCSAHIRWSTVTVTSAPEGANTSNLHKHKSSLPII